MFFFFFFFIKWKLKFWFSEIQELWLYFIKKNSFIVQYDYNWT